MNANSPSQNISSSQPVTFEVKEKEFNENEFAVAIAGKFGEFNAIGDYKIPPTSGNFMLSSSDGQIDWMQGIPNPPESGTYVLGAINGSIQWIATEECE